MSDVLDARARGMVALVEEKTGRTTQDFAVLAVAAGLGGPEVKPGARIEWLKRDFGLGHGHAMALAHAIKQVLDQTDTAEAATPGPSPWRRLSRRSPRM